jgi:AcrR family transcriptional regulator
VVPAPIPVSRRERNKQEKRERIIAAARELFATRGFATTTTAEVATRADIGVGTLFLYVASKEDLLVLVFRDEMDREAERAFATLPRGSLLDELVHGFTTLIAIHDRDRALARVLVKELLFVGGEAGASTQAFVDRLVDRIAARIERAQRAGRFAPDVPAREVAENCLCIHFALLQNWLGQDSPLPAAEHVARLRRALALQLRGFETR